MAESLRSGTVRRTAITVATASAIAQVVRGSAAGTRKPAGRQPRYVVSPVGTGLSKTFQSQWYSTGRSVQRFVVGVLEEGLEILAHREVERETLGRDRLAEPLLVDLVDLAGGLDAGDGSVDQRFEGRVAFAQDA